MNTNGILKGAIVLSLGLFVPAIYHALLMLSAVEEPKHGFESIAYSFFKLPWVVWPYLIVMTLLGLLLIVDGIKGERE